MKARGRHVRGMLRRWLMGVAGAYAFIFSFGLPLTNTIPWAESFWHAVIVDDACGFVGYFWMAVVIERWRIVYRPQVKIGTPPASRIVQPATTADCDCWVCQRARRAGIITPLRHARGIVPLEREDADE